MTFGGGVVYAHGVKCCWWKPKRIDELQTHFSFIYSGSARLLPSTQETHNNGCHCTVSPQEFAFPTTKTESLFL